eukprot:gene48061-52512_t
MFFGGNPTGYIPGEAPPRLAMMARHQLVGWGWQQGEYDFPCKEEECLAIAAENFS